MRASSVAWSLALVITGCRGNREPPISAGEGLAISGPALERAISVDSARVPLLRDCPPGKAVFRTDQGWSCGDLSVVDPREIERLRAEARQATDAVAALVQAQQSLSNRLSPLEHAPPYSMAAITCTPDSESIRNNRVFQQGGAILHQSTGSFNVFCPVTPNFSDVRWAHLKMMYRDGDGPGTGSQVTAHLRRLWLRPGTREPETIAELDSNHFSDTETTENEVVFNHPFDFADSYYYLQVSLTQTRTSTTVYFGGFSLAN